jgi:uncharacterized membrane protein
MADAREVATPSTVKIRQHPVHPTIVVFPVAFLTGTPFADIAFLYSGDAFWAQAAFWLASAGLVMGLLAALIGMIDFFTMNEVRQHISAWSHFLAGMMVLALAGANVQFRWDDPQSVIWPVGLMLSATMAGMVAATGWLGGTLTFKHGIGTYGRDLEQEGGEDAPPRP